MTQPKHISHVPDHRKAIALYNFVELPDKLVEAEALPDGDLYHSDRHTGKIECKLTTSSPLYIRCGLTTTQFNDGKESKDNPEFFYTNLDTLKPVLPGSSLRGMLRTLIEIASFAKVDRVSGQNHFFFRAVAADKDDPLKQEYTKYIKNVKAGYLNKRGDRWFIHPVKTVQDTTFAWVKEEYISDLAEFIKMDDAMYLPQYIQVSYRQVKKTKTRYFVEGVSLPSICPTNIGMLVTSGNMKLADDKPTTRRNHCIVFQQSPNPNGLEIDTTAIQHYCDALTDFQKDAPFNKDMGVLEEGRPIFYCQPENGKPVTFFGQSPNFRIPYSSQGNGHAATARDFIPLHLKDPEEKECGIPIVDIAEAIFGFVRGNKRENSDQSRAGRIFVSDAICTSDGNDIWYEEQPIIPQILASPKPTTFQHYLVQPEENQAAKPKLKHYASEGTVIRGHKLYWHKGSRPDFKHPQPQEAQEKQATQITKIKPIKSDVSFKFTIHFENLSNIEIGALLWVLDIAKNDDYRLSLGMGKPLGMGAVKIESTLHLSDREQRYSNLFEGNVWAVGETLKDDPGFASEFENYIAGSFREIPRIQMLLSMLKWKDLPAVSDTRYMEIERDIKKEHLGKPSKPTDKTVNEYKDRFVLPTPLDVRQNDRQHNRNLQTPPNIDTIKPKPKSSDTPKYKEGDTLEAQITNINGTNVTYELPDRTKRTKNKFKQAGSLQVGQNVRVRVVTLKEDGSIKKVEFAGSLSNIA